MNLNLQSELMYVNYGRVEDYRWLVSNKSLNVTGKIVIARYGKIYRGDKVMEGAEQWGMIAGDTYLHNSLYFKDHGNAYR